MVTREPAEIYAGNPLSELLGYRACARNLDTFLFGKSNLPSITHESIAQAWSHFNALKLKGQRATIAEKILKEITCSACSSSWT
jgi:excinuclease ABC subunit A